MDEQTQNPTDDERTDRRAGACPPPESGAPSLQTQLAAATAGWKRALADYDNLKKDLVRERGEMRRDAAARAAESFLAVLDNFDAAVKFTPDLSVLSRAERGTPGDPSSDADSGKRIVSWLSGILFIRTQLETALRDLGLEPFGQVGDAFDANLHEAVSSRVIPSEAEGSREVVAEVVRRGWKIGDKVVRPASVVVSAAIS